MTWYNPKDASSALDAGWYPATIETSNMTKSKNGLDMEVIEFRVYAPDRERVIKDYFHSKNLWRYKWLAEALNQKDEFDDGVFLASHFVGKAVELQLKIEDSEQYGEQNKIAGIDPDGTHTRGVSGTASKPAAEPGAQPVAELSHDDIPF